MKKILATLVFGIFISSASAQTQYDNKDIYQGIERADNFLDLTQSQASKIKKLSREYADKFRAIGKDRSISGYEKGQRKRALAEQKRKEIDKILNKNQINKWNSKYDRDDFKDIVSDKYDDMLDRLEDRYDDMIERVEDNDHLSKSEKKVRIKELKSQYKAEKEKLKQKEKNAKKRYRN